MHPLHSAACCILAPNTGAVGSFLEVGLVVASIDIEAKESQN